MRVRSPRDEHDDLGRALASLQKRYNDLVGALQKERRGSEKEQKAVSTGIKIVLRLSFTSINLCTADSSD